MDLIISQDDKGVYDENRRLNAVRETFSKQFSEAKLEK